MWLCGWLVGKDIGSPKAAGVEVMWLCGWLVGKDIGSPKAAGVAHLGAQVVSAWWKGRRCWVGWGLGRAMSPPQLTRQSGEHRELPQRDARRNHGWKRILAYYWVTEHLWQTEKYDFFPSVNRKINIFVWCLQFKCLHNVSDYGQDGEAIIGQGLWGTGPFIRGRHSSFVGEGQSPPMPIAGYGQSAMPIRL